MGGSVFVWMILVLFLLPSCYSYRVVNEAGVPEPDPFNTEEGFYRHKKVHVLDTVVKLDPVEYIPMMVEEGCATEGFHSFEVKNTFGGLLLHTFTFGRKRNVKVKYVCIKPQEKEIPWLEMK